MKAIYISPLLLIVAAAFAADPPSAPDQSRGALLFQTCSSCHSVLGDGVGPNLYGIYGKRAGTQPGFKYSSAMLQSGLTWDEATLRAFITNPQALVKGTLMTFPGYSSPADVNSVVEYIKTLK
jgi:cytochrome c